MNSYVRYPWPGKGDLARRNIQYFSKTNQQHQTLTFTYQHSAFIIEELGMAKVYVDIIVVIFSYYYPLMCSFSVLLLLILSLIKINLTVLFSIAMSDLCCITILSEAHKISEKL